MLFSDEYVTMNPGRDDHLFVDAEDPKAMCVHSIVINVTYARPIRPRYCRDVLKKVTVRNNCEKEINFTKKHTSTYPSSRRDERRGSVGYFFHGCRDCVSGISVDRIRMDMHGFLVVIY